jgi:glucokinase
MNEEMRVSKESFYTIDYQRFILVGDVGGTNTYLAIMGVKDNKNFDMIVKHTYLTKEVKFLPDCVNSLLKEADDAFGIKISIACIGAAGPVTKRRDIIKLTNADITADAGALLSKTMLKRVILINDFEAIGYGIELLNMEKDVLNLKAGSEQSTNTSFFVNTCSIIGAGTGLGISIVPYNKIKHFHIPLPSEGGHIDFTPYDQFEMELVSHIKENRQTESKSFPSYENVLSGKGMENIFSFFAKKNKAEESELFKKISSLSGIEKLREIEANYENDKTCKQTIDLFMKFYARAAKNIALLSACYSGLFITGRIALKNIERFKEKSFIEEFEKSDKKVDILDKIPVYLITNTELGLYGCCNVAVNFFNIT